MKYLVTAFLFTTACASVNSVSLTSIPATRTQEVKAQTSRTIILGFNFDNDYVDDLTTDLKQKCPNGKVTGILTKDETIMYFLFFVWKRQVTATGYCLANSVSEGKKRTRGTASESGPIIEDPGKEL